MFVATICIIFTNGIFLHLTCRKAGGRTQTGRIPEMTASLKIELRAFVITIGRKIFVRRFLGLHDQARPADRKYIQLVCPYRLTAPFKILAKCWNDKGQMER